MSRQSPWFKCFPTDWLEGTRNLTPEQRGIYFDCLCLIYEFERPLKDDDKWMSHQLHISPRLWRSIRDALVAAGKLVVVDGGLTNVRANFEIDSRLTQRRVKAESAVKRERAKRETSENRKENNETEAQKDHYARLNERQEARGKSKEPPLTPPSSLQAKSWEDDCAARADDHSGVIFADGKVTLVNGTRQLWLEKFGGDAEDLDLALLDAAGTVQVNNRSTPIAAQVQRRLAIILRDRREKDKRYAAAVAQNRKADKPKTFKPSRW